jgi:glucokinase
MRVSGKGKMILAGDVGGTKVRLALSDSDGGKRKFLREQLFLVKNYPSLEGIVEEFLGASKVTAACFGVPAPVLHQHLRLTNLPWTLDSHDLAENLEIPQVFFINDLEANGYGIAELSAEQIFSLNEGEAIQEGNRALIAAGTGLGEGLLIWNSSGYTPHPSEGGHADFAPRNEDEIDLLRFLRQKFNGRVSFERVVSGMGLGNIYGFLRDVRRFDEPAWLAERMAQEDPNAVITEMAMAERSEICEKTLEMFVSAYGAEAANLAMKVLSVGGVYVGGGIAPRILEKLKDGSFMKAFTDKGRLSPMLAQMPVRVILESRAALLGAAAYAQAHGALS